MKRRSNFVLALPLVGIVTLAAAQSPDYLDAIATVDEFELVSIPSQIPGEVQRLTKFLLPASDDPALLHPVFQNVNLYPFHRQFMSTVFPSFFPGLSLEEYEALVLRRETRQYFAGALEQLDTSQGDLYGFTVYADESPGELLLAAEIRDIYNLLSGVFKLGPLAYAPRSPAAQVAATDWDDPGFPVYLGSALNSTYQAYNPAIGYGRVRILTIAEFAQANDSCGFSFQDILILEQSPFDIEGVVGGVITENTQTELSHIFLRTANRGTPNAFLADATEIFQPLEGQLIRLEVKALEYIAEVVEQPEADTWWRDNRPSLSADPVEDAGYATLDSLEEMDISDAAPMPAVSRFGGKASNFARLQQRIMTGSFEPYKEKGFGIPLRYYREFLQTNRTASPLNPTRQVTYEEYLEELFSMPRFQSDTRVRCVELEKFRDTVEDDGIVDPALVSQLIDRIPEVFGSTRVSVRFRSSSNIEDGLEFNGAGLYDSTGACADDNLDGNDAGPSLCDPSKNKERTIERALKRVWASLWTFRAYEEREFFQIPQDKVSMALLVSRSFLDEEANAVAFTGNPANALDPNYLVTAQVGEESVVHPDPTIRAEKDVLELDGGGNVTRIERPQQSTILPDGQDVVLTDAELTELASILWEIEQKFPVELGTYDRNRVLFDTEIKIEAGGELAMKQVRPFLLPEVTQDRPTFELEVPPDTVVCGVFAAARSLKDEYARKSQMRLRAGTHELPTGVPHFDGDLIEEVLVGPDQVPATSTSPGRFRLETKTPGNGSATYTFTYEETFSLPGGDHLNIGISLDFDLRRGEELAASKIVDDESITDELIMSGRVGAELVYRYSSCSYGTLPLWEGRVELEGGDLIHFEERYRPAQAGSAPANILAAQVHIGGSQRDVQDYWRLVYAARHHNVRVKYWIVLDQPILLAGVGHVHVVEIHAPEDPDSARVNYLGSSFATTLSSPEVLCFQKAFPGELAACNFRRGDVDSSGFVNLTDPILALGHLFQGGPAPTCPDAADFNDDGVLDLADVIFSVAFLFQGVDASTPPGPYECGLDPSQDDLENCDDASCR